MSALDGFVQEVTNGLQSAKDFAGAQLPEIAKQAVSYEIASDACNLAIALGVIGICYRLALVVDRKNHEEKYSDWGMLFVPITCVVILSFLFIIFDLQCLMKALFAPKIYLLEYVAHLARACK